MSRLVTILESFIDEEFTRKNQKPYDMLYVDKEQLQEIAEMAKGQSISPQVDLSHGLRLQIRENSIGVGYFSPQVMFVLRKMLKPERIAFLTGYMINDIQVRPSSLNPDEKVTTYPEYIIPLYRTENQGYAFGDKLEFAELMKVIAAGT